MEDNNTSIMQQAKSLINKYRENTNMTYVDLAGKIGVTPKKILEWENGISNPDLSTLKKIATILEDELTNLTNFKNNIGEIDFLSSDGKITYTTKYNDVNIFEKDIKECLNNGDSIDVRDFSKQNIYSNAIIEHGNKHANKILCNLENTKKLQELEYLQEFYPTTAPIITDNETVVSIFTKMCDDNSAVKYEIEYSPFGFNKGKDKFMYVDTYKDIYNTYPSIEDVKEFMDTSSYEKLKSRIENFANCEFEVWRDGNLSNCSLNEVVESWQEKLSHSDKDNDGIPDIIDETYNPPEYFYRYATPEEIEKLKQKDIDFEFKPKKPCDQYLIKHLKSDCDKINSILQQDKTLRR